MLILCFEEQLSASVPKRLKKFISAPVLLREPQSFYRVSLSTQSPPLLEPVQLYHISSYTSIALFTYLLSKTQQIFGKCSVLPQLKLTDSRGPFQSCISLTGWELPSDQEQIIAYSLSKMFFETFPPQESTQSSEVIGWSDLILAHDSLRTNPFLLLRTLPCRSLALLVLYEFTDD